VISVRDIEFKYGCKSNLKIDSVDQGAGKEVAEYKYVKGFCLKVSSLKLADGKSLAITGVSGSGKSTFLKLLSGELALHRGSISILGHKLNEMRDNARRNFRLKNYGMIFQDSPLLEYLTIKDNILLPANIVGIKKRLDLKELCANCGIEELINRYPSQLSEGEKQRAAICRALISSPKVVLADEPTSSLDPVRGEEITDLLIQNCQKYNCTLIMVTHDYSLLDKFDQKVDIGKLGDSDD